MRLVFVTVLFAALSLEASPLSQAGSLHTLTVTIKGRAHLCLSAVPEPPLGRPEKASDVFELRAPHAGNVTYGRVLARADSATWSRPGCVLVVTFRLASSLGRFSFFDATTGGIWYGFDSRALPRLRWRIVVIDEGMK